MLKQLVANGLIYKAQGGGTIDKAGVAAAGGTTEAMLSYTSTAAAGQGFLVNSEESAASGFGAANKNITRYYENVGSAAALSLAKAFGDTILTAFGGNPASAMLAVGAGYVAPAVTSLLNFMGTPPADATSTFSNPRSGENFLPEPNSRAAATAATYNFNITAASSTTQDLVTEIKNVLVQIETDKKVSEV
jgi:hypothetical protein